ncbi:DUF397 domain-containing protein [Actinoplanes aureus]|jgi:hypothetical protein|uniref:DUF397 domain-containing protein n=1 Tax=Actinoplanes aureus TaxID=2792083 RepID=A0A931CHM9_9ACTN|nr:DUF397 domain-containing protein [Actinoplanes aureus]MBG0567443.1 DUF397 domain-containing protein [Actinoplanes aureus]
MGDTTTRWERSSFCASGSCVEVARIDEDIIAVRDGKNPAQPALMFTRAEWSAFLDRVAGGDLARV